MTGMKRLSPNLSHRCPANLPSMTHYNPVIYPVRGMSTSVQSLMLKTVANVEKVRITMSKQNKAIARRIFEEIETQGNLNAADEVFSSDFVGHMPMGDLHGPASMKQFVTSLRTGFPDLYSTVEDQVAEDDRVVTRFRARGTHRGEFMGVPASGKPMDISGIIVCRFANGKIIEQWGMPDLLSLMQQIGAVPSLEQSRQ